MTVEELAARIGEMANRCCERSDGFKEEIAMTVREMVEVAIGRAVAAEREACAMLVSEWDDDPAKLRIELAAAIRARGESALEVQPDAVAGN